MISIDNAALERIIKQLLISQQIEQDKWSCLVFELEPRARSPIGSSNPDHYDLVARFTGYIERGKRKDIRALLAQMLKEAGDMQSQLDSKARAMIGLVSRLNREFISSPHAEQIGDELRPARLRPLGCRVKKGFEVLSTRPRSQRPRGKRTSPKTHV